MACLCSASLVLPACSLLPPIAQTHQVLTHLRCSSPLSVRLDVAPIRRDHRNRLKGTDFYMTSLNAQGVIDEWNNGINIVGILETMLPQVLAPLLGEECCRCIK